MNVIWYGTAAISVETSHQQLVFDPFVPVYGSGIDVSQQDFLKYDRIFLTHGHIDHIASVPTLVKDSNAHIWCTKTPARTLAKKGVNANKIHVIQPGDQIANGEIEVKVYQGRHIRFDRSLVVHTVFNTRVIRYLCNLPWLLYQNAVCKENGETAAYQITADNKNILLLGSLGIDPHVIYPKEVDLLILPFQGSSDLITPSLAIIGEIKPKRIMLDHFDDSFPPISNTISLDEFAKTMQSVHPDIQVIVPKYKVPVHL